MATRGKCESASVLPYPPAASLLRITLATAAIELRFIRQGVARDRCRRL
jgi:hypothetical protein